MRRIATDNEHVPGQYLENIPEKTAVGRVGRGAMQKTEQFIFIYCGFFLKTPRMAFASDAKAMRFERIL